MNKYVHFSWLKVQKKTSKSAFKTNTFRLIQLYPKMVALLLYKQFRLIKTNYIQRGVKTNKQGVSQVLAKVKITWLYDCLPKWPIREPLSMLCPTQWYATSCSIKRKEFPLPVRLHTAHLLLSHTNRETEINLLPSAW